LANKPLIIYNPTANKGNAGKILPVVETMLREAGVEYDLVLTEGPEHAQKLAKQAVDEGCPLVVAAGGDGTVNEVINGLMQTDLNHNGRPALAVLPVGRGNDFAYGADIPMELKEAVDILVNGQRRSIDIGHVIGGDYPQGRYFGNGIGLGFDAVVGFEAAKLKWLNGAASYLVAVFRTIFLYAKAPVYEVLLDGETVRQPYLMVSIMNGRRMGGMFHMAPASENNDGALDLCLAGQVPQIKILPLAVKFISGTQAGHPAVRMARARCITIQAVEGSIPAHADGETICEKGQVLTIEVFPASLTIISCNNGKQI
jgi:YegS/Rv2252/BmrU family lipid kinase